jgi:hypothetical protein
MGLDSKPLFHPEVIRQQVRPFNLPERVKDWAPKLQHWADLIASGRADDFKETALLPDFLTCPPGVMFSIANRERAWQIGAWQRKKECFVLNGTSSKSWECFRALARKSRSTSPL